MGLYFDTVAAAQYLGLSPKTVRAQEAKGVLPGYKLGPRRLVFAEEALAEYRRRHLGKYGRRSPAHRQHNARSVPPITPRLRRCQEAIDLLAGDVLELVRWGGTRRELVAACERLRGALEAEWENPCAR